VRIDHDTNTVIFDNLVSAKRDLGSNEGMTATIPAEKAVVANAPGEFSPCTIEAVNARAISNAEKISVALKPVTI